MAYEVTATRRRPQKFEDLAGQEFVAETLKNSIKTGQIAHAYLFTGPRGCGKTSTARILAKSLNCQNSSGPTCTPCGTCESCRAITNSSSMDVIEIDGASTNSVNDIRQIRDELMFPPASSRYKIYIIACRAVTRVPMVIAATKLESSMLIFMVARLSIRVAMRIVI